MTTGTKPTPKGPIPYLTCQDAKKECDWLMKALNGKMTHEPAVNAESKVMHAAIELPGEQTVFLCDECPQMMSPTTLKGTPVSIYLMATSKDDVDTLYQQAIAAGGKKECEPTQQFWGDYWCCLTSPGGHCWQIAYHTGEMSEPPEGMKPPKDATTSTKG